MQRRSLLSAGSFRVFLAAGGGDGDGGGGDGETAAPQAPASGVRRPASARTCRRGSSPRSDRASRPGRRYAPGGAGVKSGDFNDVYFASADIHGAGLEGSGDLVTLAKSGPLKVGGGLIYSVEPVANEFSEWGDGGQTDAQLSIDDDGAKASQKCVEAKG